jgi:hypothetical protein
MKTFALIAALALPCAALAQAPRAPEPPPERSDIARSMCEALAGAERERCFAELKPEPAPRGGAPRTCDDLLGPEKELCLKKGGTVKAGSGASRPSP